MRLTATLLFTFALGLAACSKSGTTAADETPPASTAGDTGAVEPTPDEPEPAPAAARAVVLRHGPMTFVMDSPEGQMSKAASAIAGGGLVAQLTALGVVVSYERDPSLDDTVVVVVADGTELGRAELREASDKDAPEPLVAAVKAHFQLSP